MNKLKRALYGGVAVVVAAVVLTGCKNSISAHYMSALTGQSVARVWTAPHAGVVDISGLIQAAPNEGDMEVSISKNGNTIWGPETASASNVRADLSSVTVIAGDVIRFIAKAKAVTGAEGAKILWDPDVTYE